MRRCATATGNSGASFVRAEEATAGFFSCFLMVSVFLELRSGSTAVNPPWASLTLPLLLSTADPTVKDLIGGFTALHYAAMHGRARIARLMLESEFCPDIINAKSNDGWTPLHVAAHYGRDSFVRLLLEFRAEVDPLSDKGTTPLQLAIIRERSSCVRILLDHSANIDIQNGFLLRYAVIKGNHMYCRMFLQRGADTNLGRQEDGQTPLHLSALRDDVLCAQMLYMYGANTNTRNYEGQTPAAVSATMSAISRPCLDFLLEVTRKCPYFCPNSGGPNTEVPSMKQEPVLLLDQSGWIVGTEIDLLIRSRRATEHKRRLYSKVHYWVLHLGKGPKYI